MEDTDLPEDLKEPKDRGILDRKINEVETTKEKTDEEYIQEAISQTDEFNGAQNITGDAFLTLPDLKAFKLNFDMGVEEKNAVAFVFPEITLGVLKFMTESAKEGNLIHLLAFTNNVVLAKDYKPVKVNPDIA